MIKVSVIIPVYNVEKYLEECLQSICNQTLKDIEIICINDGSTDKSGQILKDFAKKDKRIVLIEQKNQGVSIARNNGLKAAKGEYIGFVDSDDWIDPDFYEKLYKTAQKFDADIALAGHKSYTDEKSGKEKITVKYNKEKVITNFNKKIKSLELCVAVWDKIYKPNLILENQIWFPEGRTYEDGIWNLHIFYLAKKICTVPKCFYHYRYNLTSIVHTTKSDPVKLNDSKISTQEILSFARKNKLNWNFPIRFRLKIYFLGIQFFKIIDYENYWKFYIWKIPIIKIKKIYFHPNE